LYKGDGFGYQKGDYLFIHYEVEKVLCPSARDGEVVIHIDSIESDRKRLKCTLKVWFLISKNIWIAKKAIFDFAKLL
jgi:hypothetical protein